MTYFCDSVAEKEFIEIRDDFERLANNEQEGNSDQNSNQTVALFRLGVHVSVRTRHMSRRRSLKIHFRNSDILIDI